jgi:ATP-dependent Clp protease adaptor protein ClpS
MSATKPEKWGLVVPKVEKEIAEPPMYKVLLHNDHYTTKEFVVEVLMAVFGKSLEDAAHLMFYVHRNGTGVCGVYTRELAETKVKIVTQLARENGFPLRTTMEKE